MYIPQFLYDNSITKEFTRMSKLFSPYFGLSGPNLKRTLAALAIIASCLITAFSMVYIQSAFTALNVILLQPGTSLNALAWGVVECLIPVCVYSGFFSFSWGLTEWLGSDLNHQLSHSLITKVFDDKAFYGVKFINRKGKTINPSVVLQNDIWQISFAGPTLGSSLIRTILDFLVGIQQLWVLSAPLVITFSSFTVAIPAYMVLVAIPYSAIYSFIITFLDKNLKKIEAKLKSKNDKFAAYLHHVEEHAESIALKQGGNFEKEKLLNNLNKVTAIQHQRQWIGSVVNFAQNIIMNLSYMCGLLLAAPGIHAGLLDGSNAFSVANYFTAVVNFFTWKKNSNASLVDLNVSLDRFELFQQLLHDWDEINKANQLKVVRAGDVVELKGISVATPEGLPIFKEISFTLPNNEAIVIQGPSGAGKTTLFRCLAGLWPYAKGEVILPSGDKGPIHYIPQQPYFPIDATLLEAINYPHGANVSVKEKEEIISLMREIGLKEEIINSLDSRDEWHKKLSGGEQQRIAVIGAIRKQPAVLFMDEATNGLDIETKQAVENAFRKHLKNTTIVGIDHQAAAGHFKPFFDHKLHLKKDLNLSQRATRLKVSPHLTDTRCTMATRRTGAKAR